MVGWLILTEQLIPFSPVSGIHFINHGVGMLFGFSRDIFQDLRKLRGNFLFLFFIEFSHDFNIDVRHRVSPFPGFNGYRFFQARTAHYSLKG